MEKAIDDYLMDENLPEIIYGTFWQRAFAMLIDTLVLSPVIVLTLINYTTWKSPVLLTLFSLITLCYKPFCEYKFSASLGKMALKLIVVNKDFQKAELKGILLRNIFFIIVNLASMANDFYIFSRPEFQSVTTIIGFNALPFGKTIRDGILIFDSIIYISEITFLLRDEQKRALHDRIAKTYVIKKSQNKT